MRGAWGVGRGAWGAQYFKPIPATIHCVRTVNIAMLTDCTQCILSPLLFLFLLLLRPKKNKYMKYIGNLVGRNMGRNACNPHCTPHCTPLKWRIQEIVVSR